jgi:2-polyprenyl-3-methyl-5-hydroxy-6-metoxy-1,4-benzoquinol methylase
MFWYSVRHHDLTMSMFRELAPSLVFYPFPLIWLKSDNAGIASDVRRHPRHIYETCLLATRGNRHILKVVGDAYSAPTDKRWHASTKPEPVLKHFMSMLVDQDTTLLDPTCGGGSAIRVAEELGARTVLGMDIDESTVGNARQALRAARMLRTAAKSVVKV